MDRFLFVLLLFFLLTPLEGFSALIPNTVIPGQVEKQLQNTVSMSQRNLYRAKETPLAMVPVISPVSASKQLNFVLRSVHIVGSTIYSQESLQALYQPYLNKRISSQKLGEINAQITKQYLKDGYLLSRAYLPTQNLKSGHIRVEILEAYIENVKVQGKIHGLEKFLVAYTRAMKKSRPLQEKVLQHYILLLNQLPGVKATLQINPIAENSAAQELTFVIKQRRFSPYGFLNNNQSRYLGSQNLFLNANMYSLLQGGDSTILTGATAPSEPRVLQYYYLFHRIPLGVYGNHLDFLADYTQTKPNLNIPPSSITSKAGELAIYYYHPFILQTKDKLEGRLALAYYDSKTSSFNGPGDVKVDIPSFRAKAIYEHREPKYLDRIETELSRGLYVFGARIGPSADNNPVLNYTKLYYYVTHVQMLSKSFSFLVDSMGQYAFNPLVPVEKIPYGGFLFGRAYDPAEIIGDHGIMGGIELRYNRFPRSFDSIQYFTRYDIGKVWNKSVAPAFALNSIYSAASLSAGLRFILTKDCNFELSVGRPLTRAVEAETLSGHNGKSLRFFFNFSYTPF